MATTEIIAPLSFQYQDDIRQIAEPFFNYSDTCYFSFERIYCNNDGFYLSNTCEITQEAIKNNVFINYAALKKLTSENREINTLHNTFYYLLKEHNKVCEEFIKKNFGLCNTFLLVDQYEDYFDIFAFSSKLAEKFSRFCFNNLDCLVKFKSYFRDSAKTMINELDNNRIPMSVNYVGNSVCENNSIATRNRKKLLKAIEPKDYYFTLNNKPYQMTKREFECLKCLAQGRTMKEAGRILNISDRTVEEHIISLKNRFTVNSKAELIDLYLASDLIIL